MVDWKNIEVEQPEYGQAICYKGDSGKLFKTRYGITAEETPYIKYWHRLMTEEELAEYFREQGVKTVDISQNKEA